jgi:hypothetical protein
MRDLITYIEHGKRLLVQPVSDMDVIYALKRHGHTLIGFGR